MSKFTLLSNYISALEKTPRTGKKSFSLVKEELETVISTEPHTSLEDANKQLIKFLVNVNKFMTEDSYDREVLVAPDTSKEYKVTAEHNLETGKIDVSGNIYISTVGFVFFNNSVNLSCAETTSYSLNIRTRDTIPITLDNSNDAAIELDDRVFFNLCFDVACAKNEAGILTFTPSNVKICVDGKALDVPVFADAVFETVLKAMKAFKFKFAVG